MINITNRRARRAFLFEMTRIMQPLENTYARELRPILGRQYLNAAKFVEQGLLTGIDLAVDSEYRRMVETLKNHYRRVAKVFLKKVYDAVDISLKSTFNRLAEEKGRSLWFNEADVSPSATKTPKDEFWGEMDRWMVYQAEHSKIRRLHKTTKKNIIGIIQKGMGEGISHKEIAKEIRSNSRVTNPVRALRIARTETHTAGVKSVQAAVRSTRIEMEKEWMSALDDRTRIAHRAADGERVAMDAKFTRTGEALDYPGDPSGSPGNIVNCRCVVLYHTVRSTQPVKPYEPPITSSNAPMNIIGKMDNCLVEWKGVFIIEFKKVPQSCEDYVRNDEGKWFLKGKEVSTEEFERLNKMRLPPAWRNVVVSTDLKSKIQAIGLDKAGRWQYRYSAEHIEEAARKKFNRIKSFKNDLVGIRDKIKEGMKAGDGRAYLLELENKTAIRAGSSRDFRAKKKAYGLTTLRHEHIEIKGDLIKLNFIAKEGIPVSYRLKDNILSKWLKERKINTKPGEKLFPDITASKLNKYLKELADGKKYTIKDFRTYHGTRIAYDELKKYAGQKIDKRMKKRIIKEVSERVSGFLHNTPTMARNSYIDPMVWDFIGGLK